MNNEKGSVVVFITLMVVLLLIMIGMGLDSGQLSYVRSQGQPAVDAAALAAVSAIPTNNPDVVTDRATKFNGRNTYLDSTKNQIGSSNVTLIRYDPSGSPEIAAATGVVSGISTGNANGVRVALEKSSENPYAANAGMPMVSPLFLTPLANLFGVSTPNSTPVSVSAVAVLKAVPGLPIVVSDSLCGNSSATLEFRTSSGTARWATYYQTTNSTNVKNLFDGLPACAGQPSVDIGFCTNIGSNTKLNSETRNNLYDNTLPNLFKANPSECYLVPVVKSSDINSGSCASISEWAKFCPNADIKIAVPTGRHQLKGSLTCDSSANVIFTSRDTQCYVPTLVRDTKSGM